MIFSLMEFLGPWVWVVIGLVILGAEIIAPSTILLWPAIAALIVGFITLLLGIDNPIWPWQAQVLVFLILTLLSAYLGKRYVKTRKIEASENPDLNERSSQLVGQTGILKDAIVNGYGRVKIGDTTWRAKGEDAKAGASVRVVNYDGATLIVEPV